MMHVHWRKVVLGLLLVTIPAVAAWLTHRARPAREAPATGTTAAPPQALTVLTHAPVGRDVPISTDGITVMFNRAVVPLTTLDEGRDRAIPLQITPAVDGKFFWLGTRGFIFRPAKPFDPATTYHVALPAGITAITGERLADPVRWEFSTVAPRVVDWTPNDDHLLLPKEGVFSLRFNIAMDRASVERGLTIHEAKEGDLLSTGRKFVWLDTDHLVVVKLTGPLPWDATLTVTLAEGVRGKYGAVGTESAETVTYTTPAKTATIEEVVYTDGSQEQSIAPDKETTAPAGSGICYHFSHAIQPASFEKAFRMEGGLKGKKSAPYFYYRDDDAYDALDAKGRMDERVGYLKGCVTFLEEFDHAYRFSLHPKKIVTVSGAPLSAAADTYRLRTEHARPSLTARLTKNILSLAGPMKLPYRTINLRSIRFHFYRLLDPLHYEEWVRNGRIGALATHEDPVTKKRVPDEPLMSSIHSRLPVPVTADGRTIDASRMGPEASLDLPMEAQADTSRTVSVDLAALRDQKKLTAGLYLVEAIGRPGLKEAVIPDAVYSIIQITPVGLSLKRELDHVLVWATDIESGAPVADLPVRVSRTPWQKPPYIAEGMTNADGVAILPGTWNAEGEVCAEVTDPARGAYTCERFHRISGYRGPLRAGPHYFAYVYTDRPIYRPGQKVYFSSFIREVQEGRYFATDADLTADIKVTDAAEEVIYTQKGVKVGPGGVVHGELDLSDDDELPRGAYRVAITVGDQTFRRTFQVASYRKPAFKVDLAAARPEILSGEPLDVAVTGSYFFGAPMRKAKVDWSIMTTTYRFAPEGFTDFSFVDDDQLMKHVEEDAEDGEYDYDSEYEYDTVAGSGDTEDSDREEDPRGGGARREPGSLFVVDDDASVSRGERLDEAGRLAITYRPDLKKYPTSQVLTVETRVEDLTRQEVAGAEDLIVHKASYYLGVKPDKWVSAATEPAPVHLVSLDTQGKPVAARAFTAEVFRREYQFIERRDANGFWEYDFEPKDTKVEDLSGTTDTAGRAQVTFTPSEGGTYRVVAKGKDEKGRAIQSATTLSVWGQGYVPWRLDRPETIELVPDKQSYQVGDTAKILVKSLVPVTKALMTLERGRLLDYRLIDLGGNAAHLELPITEGMIPNLFVHLVAHVGRAADQPPMLFHGETALRIEPERKRLAVTILPDRATNNERRISGSAAPGAASSASGRTTEVPIYRPGETVTVAIETRDGAGAPRKAHVIVSVADESVLRLLDYRLPDLVQRFYFWRANSVSTSSSLRSLKAGDGGVAAGKKRRAFKDTAHFEAHLTTNAQGKGAFTFTLPDDLTTWVIEAVAIAESKPRALFEKERAALAPQQPAGVRALDAELTLSDNTLVGGQRAKIMTTLPVLVRPALPRFAVWGDRVRARVVANNQNAVPAEGTLVVTVTGDVVLGNGTTTQEIPFTVAARAEQAIPVELAIRSGARLTFAAEARDTAGKAMDAVEITLPVMDRYAPEMVATSGVTDGTAQEQWSVPNTVIQDRGGIEISVKASLGLAVATPLKQLIDFPWGCSEQRSAALLGLLMARQMSAKYGERYFDALAPVAQSEIPKHATFAEKLKLLDTKIAQIIDDLVGKFQLPGGGMRYWPDDDEPSLYPSVQTLWAFTLARELHHAVSAPAITDLTRYIQAEVSRGGKAHEGRMETGRRVSLTRLIGYALSAIRHGATRRADELAYGLWGLSLNHAWADKVAEALQRQPADLSASGASYLVMALANHQAAAAARPIAARLEALAQHAPRHVSWPKSAFFWSSAVKNTAMAARAFLTLDKNHPLPARALAFLLNRKSTTTQVSTQDNLYLAAFAYEYATVMQEEATQYTGHVDIGGRRWIEQSFGRNNLLEERRQQVAMQDLTALPMPADIVVGKEGTGALYYDLLLKYYLPPAQTPTREEGLIVAREYYALDDVKEAHPLTQFAVGENYRGHITLVVPQELHYVLIQDLLPAGFEPIDMTLATSARALQAMASLGRTTESPPDNDWRAGFYDDVITVEEYGADWGFSHQEIRDDAIVWSDKIVPPGVYHLRYPVRATTAGTFLAAGATAFEFYEPEVFARSRTRVVEVRETVEKPK